MRLAVYLVWFATKTVHHSFQRFKPAKKICDVPESQAKRIR